MFAVQRKIPTVSDLVKGVTLNSNVNPVVECPLGLRYINHSRNDELDLYQAAQIDAM